jgi:catechol 2,3-dioxygenase-like lactoylglutathione lyase family enzyme
MLAGLPALVLGRRLLAQQAAPPIRVQGLHQVSLVVSDAARSVRFYQEMFGMPVQARHGGTTLLRIGDGPRYLAICGAAAGETPKIDHLGIAVDQFDAKAIMQALERHGLSRAQGAGGGLSGGPLRVRLTERAGTPEIFLGDPDGIVVQLMDRTYCGGSGPLGATCGAPEASASRGLFQLRDLSHFTIQVPDGQRANEFYQRVFGLDIQAMQAATPALGVGSGVHFLMFTGGAGAGRGAAPGAPVPPRPARIDHVCVSMANFNLDAATKALESRGIKPRGTGAGAATGPLLWWVSMRMPNRGGAPEGTPELYFSDPDGLSIQLQDVRYCGGGGYLGDVCEGGRG